MIFPAVSLIFMFGLFPVLFAVYVSLHRWKLKIGNFLGLSNYIRSIDMLGYVAFFGIGLGALAIAFVYIRQTIRTAQEKGEQPWLWLLPGIVLAAGFLQFLRFSVMLLPEILAIGDKIVGLEKTRELFGNLLSEAFQAELVRPELTRTVWLLLVGLILTVGLLQWRSGERSRTYLFWFFLSVFSAVLGFMILRFTYSEVLAAYATAAEEGQSIGLWAQIITIFSGLVLVGLAWLLWGSASKQDNSAQMLLRLFGAIALLIGGWLLIGELPKVIGAGDPDVWEGLKVTAYYSLGTVPFQLTLSLFLAYLLFQELKGKEIFRIVFFLPYVTPAVASAGIFRVMFSNRPSAPINQVFGFLGIEAQDWLLEPNGVFDLIADGLGISIPSWAAGPSMALVVIMIFGIWTFVGFNIVIYLAGLGNIPSELTEAAEIDGAGRWDVFRHITFPLLSPTTYFLSLLAVIGTFKAFNHVWILRNDAALGTTDTFSITVFVELFEKARFGYASALAFVLFGVILTLTLINNRIQGTKVFYG
jgi:multiple sugar transport system permease protein